MERYLMPDDFRALWLNPPPNLGTVCVHWQSHKIYFKYWKRLTNMLFHVIQVEDRSISDHSLGLRDKFPSTLQKQTKPNNPIA